MIPKISVIVPVYNSEKYLRECLDSIVNQTLSGIQVLMVDDGSTDGSASICKEYEEIYEGFEYYYKENGGTATARNEGLKKAKGEYIGFVDSDDYIELDMFERMYSAAKSNCSDIVFCPTRGLDDYTHLESGFYDASMIKEHIFPKILPHIVKEGTFRTVDWGNWSRIFRREIIQDNELYFYEGSRRCEDFAFSVECTIHANSYTVIDEGELYHYRPNENSKSRSYTQNMWKSIRALMVYMQGFMEKYSEYDFSKAMDMCVFYFSTSVIRNELRNPERDKIVSNISKVMNDSLCCDSLSKISLEGMNAEYTNFYRYMKCKDAKGLYKYCKKQNFKKKKIAPILKKLFKNKFIMNLYMKVRGK